MDIFLVGGAVRDKQLGLAIKDRDWVVVGATPEQMLKQGYKPVGQDFPVFLHPESHEEYALARTERKSGKGYTGFTFHTNPNVSLEQDLCRRDLTINAMAETLEGELIDPYNGLKDLHRCLLRHVSPAFKEDPLRILRIARFKARFNHLGFTIADETMELMKDMVSQGEVEHLVAERVWSETERALQGQNPQVYFNVLNECRALEVIMPLLSKAIDQKISKPDSNTPNCLQALSCSVHRTKNTTVRWASLVHRATDLVEEYQLTDLETMMDQCRIPKAHKELALLSCRYHHEYHEVLKQPPEKVLALLTALDWQRRKQRFEDFLLVCETGTPDISIAHLESLPQTQFLQAITHKLEAITAQSFIESGFKGKELGLKMQEARLKIITDMSDQWEIEHQLP